MFSQFKIQKDTDASVDYTPVKKAIVRLVLENLGLLQPTLVLSPGQRRPWNIALMIVHRAYEKDVNIEPFFTLLTGVQSAGLGPKSWHAELLHWCLLQRQFIENKAAQSDSRSTRGLPKNTRWRHSFTTTTSQGADIDPKRLQEDVEAEFNARFR